MQINAVHERPGNFAKIALNLWRATETFAAGVGIEAAHAGVCEVFVINSEELLK